MNYSQIAPEEVNTIRSELLKPVMNTAAKSPLTQECALGGVLDLCIKKQF